MEIPSQIRDEIVRSLNRDGNFVSKLRHNDFCLKSETEIGRSLIRDGNKSVCV